MQDLYDGRWLTANNPGVKVSHPERILYPQAGIARAEVVSYYAVVAPFLIRQAAGRPLTVKRWPHGIDGPMFYQKHDPSGHPLMVRTVAELLTWVGRGALEWHAPLGSLHAPDIHDWAVLDLDPNPPVDWPEVVEVARVFKELLGLMDLPFLLKTSGQRGLHFYMAIQPAPARDVVGLMAQLAQIVVQTVPNLATVTRLKRDRGRRVYLDYLQNGHARTTVMAYSLRATSGATVSTPIDWGEVWHPPSYWTMDRVRERVGEQGDYFRWESAPVDLAVVAARHGL